MLVSESDVCSSLQIQLIIDYHGIHTIGVNTVDVVRHGALFAILNQPPVIDLTVPHRHD